MGCPLLELCVYYPSALMRQSAPGTIWSICQEPFLFVQNVDQLLT